MTTLTIEMMQDMKRRMDKELINPLINDAFNLNGFRVVDCPHIHDTYEETETYKGHPIIQWIAKFIRFDPDVHVTRVRNRGRDRVFMYGNTIIARPDTANALRGLGSAITAIGADG